MTNRLAARLRMILADEGLVTAKSSFRRGDTVTYKGRPYRLQWSGSTKYGDRAKLQFMDGTKEFWVNLSQVSDASSSGGGSSSYSRPSGGGRSGRCRGCRGPTKNAPHHPAMEGYCGYCAFDEFDM